MSTLCRTLRRGAVIDPASECASGGRGGRRERGPMKKPRQTVVAFSALYHRNSIDAAFRQPRRVARHKRFTAGKTLAQGEFISPEHFNYRRVERRCAVSVKANGGLR